MKLRYGITLHLFLLIAFTDCTGIKKEPSHTADEIKFIGLVNDYKDGKFYVDIFDWPINKAHVEVTIRVHEVPFKNDTLGYPDNWNI